MISPKHIFPGGAIRAATANVYLVIADGTAFSIKLRYATGFFLAGVYPLPISRCLPGFEQVVAQHWEFLWLTKMKEEK